MTDDEIIAKANDIIKKRLKDKVSLTSPTEVFNFVSPYFCSMNTEEFWVMFLNTRHQVIEFTCMFKGTIDGACVYPRVVAQRALELNAAAIILAHNHPSGIGEPSLADQAITRRTKDALGLLEIRLLDHFVFAGGEHVSMASRGMI